MKAEADLLEPMKDIGTFQYDHNLYIDMDPHQLQDALKFLFKTICETEETYIKSLEDALRNEGFENNIVENSLEIMKLPTEDIAYAQCWMDTLEEARGEETAVKDIGGTVNYPSIVESLANSEKTRYIIDMKSRRFKSEENPKGIRSYYFDFAEKIHSELKRVFKLDQ